MMRVMRSATSSLARRLVPLLFLPAGALAQPLPPEVVQALATSGLPESALSVYVQVLGSPQPLLAINADLAAQPASTMKLLTAAAALELHGPTRTWRTEAYLSAPLREGILEGDLLLKGYGDPGLTLERFWLLLRDLRARGLRDIRGDLVLDRTYFAPPPLDAASFDGEPGRPYNVGPDALLVNFKSVRLRFLPDARRDRVEILAEPQLAGVSVVNELALGAGECGSWPERPVAAGPVLTFRGIFPLACGEKSRGFSVLEPDAYLEALFRLLWGELGGSFTGRARSGEVRGAVPFLQQESASLGELLRDMNKFSNNVMARNLFLSLAATGQAPPLSLEGAAAAVRDWLRRSRLDFPELVLDNGSGLSRTERISARHLGQLLLHMQASPWRAEFVASLPISGMDGTLLRRLTDAPALGRAHLKTGSLEGVRATAGYLIDVQGRTLVVVILVNHPQAAASITAQDALLQYLAARGARAGCCRRPGAGEP